MSAGLATRRARRCWHRGRGSCPGMPASSLARCRRCPAGCAPVAEGPWPGVWVPGRCAAPSVASPGGRRGRRKRCSRRQSRGRGRRPQPQRVHCGRGVWRDGALVLGACCVERTRAAARRQATGPTAPRKASPPVLRLQCGHLLRDGTKTMPAFARVSQTVGGAGVGGDPCSGAVGFIRPDPEGRGNRCLRRVTGSGTAGGGGPEAPLFQLVFWRLVGISLSAAHAGGPAAATRNYPAFLSLAWSSGSRHT